MGTTAGQSTEVSGRRIVFKGSDNVRLVGDAYGEPSDPPLIFLHGGGQQRSSWSGAARRWGSSGWNAMALDARGHGESDWSPGGCYELDVFVATLKASWDSSSKNQSSSARRSEA
jgi:pimeloyl-ACP methyl ester carboxylesterase